MAKDEAAAELQLKAGALLDKLEPNETAKDDMAANLQEAAKAYMEERKKDNMIMKQMVNEVNEPDTLLDLNVLFSDPILQSCLALEVKTRVRIMCWSKPVCTQAIYIVFLIIQSLFSLHSSLV